jgi:hypothetical protein
MPGDTDREGAGDQAAGAATAQADSAIETLSRRELI